MNADLIERRRLLGLNQTQMAERCGLSKSLIIRLEGGRLKRTAHPGTLRRLADGYCVRIEDINAVCGLDTPEPATEPATAA